MVLCLITVSSLLNIFFICQILSSSTEQFKMHYLLGEVSIVDSYYPW